MQAGATAAVAPTRPALRSWRQWQWYWWECLVLVRKMLLAIVRLFFTSHVVIQCFLGMILLVIAIGAQSHWR